MMGLEPTTFCMASLSGRQPRLIATSGDAFLLRFHPPSRQGSSGGSHGESWRVTIYSPTELKREDASLHLLRHSSETVAVFAKTVTTQPKYVVSLPTNSLKYTDQAL